MLGRKNPVRPNVWLEQLFTILVLKFNNDKIQIVRLFADCCLSAVANEKF